MILSMFIGINLAFGIAMIWSSMLLSEDSYEDNYKIFLFNSFMDSWDNSLTTFGKCIIGTLCIIFSLSIIIHYIVIGIAMFFESIVRLSIKK